MMHPNDLVKKLKFHHNEGRLEVIREVLPVLERIDYDGGDSIRELVAKLKKELG